MATATWIKDLLEHEGVAYQELHHPQVYTSQAVAQREHITGHRVAKVVVGMVHRRPLAFILPPSRHVNLTRVAEVLGTREVRLANEKEMERYFTDCELGAIPALRHWRDVEVLMDASMKVRGDIVVQAGTHCDAVRLPFEDWFRMVQPRIENFSDPIPGKMLFPDEEEK